jgi:putative transcriptional regulator
MDKRLFERLVEGMQQHEEIRRGERMPSREFFVDAEKVKEIRAMTGLSQSKFARLLDVDVGTLRQLGTGSAPADRPSEGPAASDQARSAIGAEGVGRLIPFRAICRLVRLDVVPFSVSVTAGVTQNSRNGAWGRCPAAA